jgi:alkylation response protein AidB-like acyl-CoA dehydrogenase
VKDILNPVQKVEFSTFVGQFKDTLENVFGLKQNVTETSINRGIPGLIMRDVLDCKPLSVFIPSEYEGRGANVSECLKVLETASYYSLPLSLMVGINGALFLQPVSLYGQEAIKAEAFNNFIHNRNMGGLMITEPKYGSDALHMQTSFEETSKGYRIKGTKHWAGLTGWADYWLLTARRKNADGELARDIDFFVHRKIDNGIEVEEMYNNLGLYMLPYGRNKINAEVDATSRLEPKSTGVKMMLDILHRSRLQFPGMGMGFIRRMMDEAISHCETRLVGGQSLLNYDQVKERISKIQSYFTTVSAMCAYTSENAKMDVDLSRADVQANSIKTIVTDYMQEAAQSLLQLVGAKGYRLEHIAGRSIIDSRPFQIFEGSNDILYQQISESVIKSMRKNKMVNLFEYLSTNELSEKSATMLRKMLDFNIDYSLSQRKLVELGKAISRVVSMNFVINLGERGFNAEHIQNSINQLSQEVDQMINSYAGKMETAVIRDYHSDSDWRTFLVS